MRASTIPTLAVGIVLAASVTPASAMAQGVRLIPQVGLYAPNLRPRPSHRRRGLGGDRLRQEGVDPGVRARARVRFAAELRDAPRQHRVRLAVGSALGRSGLHDVRRPQHAPGSDRASRDPATARAPGHPAVLLAGGGAKRYDFELDGSTPLDDQTTATGQLGVGTELHLGPLRVVAEVSDYISSFKALSGSSGELQNDLLFTVGIVLGGG